MSTEKFEKALKEIDHFNSHDPRQMILMSPQAQIHIPTY